jgi:hypothetical protein
MGEAECELPLSLMMRRDLAEGGEFGGNKKNREKFKNFIDKFCLIWKMLL